MNDEYAKKKSGLEKEEVSELKEMISKLKGMASKEGCDVAELVEKYSEAEPEVESEGDGSKLDLIVERMKSKSEPSLEG